MPRQSKSASKPKGKRPQSRGFGRGHTRPTTQEEVKINERQELVYELVGAGWSYRAISKYLEAQGYRGTSIGTISSDFNTESTRRRAENKMKRDDIVQLELKRLDDALKVITPRLRKLGKKEDIDSLINIQKQRDRYLHISKSERSEFKANEALAKLLGVAPSEIPEPKSGK